MANTGPELIFCYFRGMDLNVTKGGQGMGLCRTILAVTQAAARGRSHDFIWNTGGLVVEELLSITFAGLGQNFSFNASVSLLPAQKTVRPGTGGAPPRVATPAQAG